MIEGKYRVLSEDGLPVRKRKRWPRAVRAVLTYPMFWVWVVMISFVGLTEGLW